MKPQRFAWDIPRDIDPDYICCNCFYHTESGNRVQVRGGERTLKRFNFRHKKCPKIKKS